MGKWKDEFIRTFQELGTVKRLTKEIKESADVEKMQKETDLNISKMCKERIKKKIRKKRDVWNPKWRTFTKFRL